MSGTNHIAGGVVFTGLYLSMFDINIYSQPIFLFFTAFFSLLPDVDHTKSLIGKVFYPVAWYINKKYGHRTITHSLLCYVILGLITAIVENNFYHDSTITKIFFWSYGSHLVLDMLTLQGVPLFYPYKKNPCVIPGNPQFRFRSADFKAEIICFLIFGLLLFSTKDLFANGFWNTYNRKSDNIQAIYNERRIYDKLIKVDYEVIKDGIKFKDTGYLVSSEKTSLILLGKSFIEVTPSEHIVTLKPIRSDSFFQIKTQSFTNYSTEKLNELCRNKAITEMKFTAELPVVFTHNNQLQQSKSPNIKYIINPYFSSSTKVDSVDNSVDKELALLTIELNNNTQEINQYYSQKGKLSNQLEQVQSNINSQDLAVKERAMKDMPGIKSDYENLRSPTDKRETINTRIAYLRSKKVVVTNQNINGFISYFTTYKN
jgi:inner membrane protein